MSSIEMLPLPGGIDLETGPILRQLVRAHRHLAELKGAALTIPNQSILIDTLGLQEAKDSSAIENIITTHDELYQSDFFSGTFGSHAAKEVQSYAAALNLGFQKITHQSFIRLQDILALQEVLEQNRAGLRKSPGTVLRNEQTGEVVYEPPQDPAEVKRLMANFIEYYNRAEPDDPDPLIRMSIVLVQRELDSRYSQDLECTEFSQACWAPTCSCS